MYFNNNFANLLSLLAEHSGTLHLESGEKIQTGEPWYAYLNLAEKGVVTCTVRSKVDDRVLFSGGRAIAWLAGVGSLSWRLEESVSQETPTVRIAAKDLENLIPRRTKDHEQFLSTFNTWSRKQRQVFALVDGVRSSKKIAAMLSQSSEEVKTVLNELQTQGVIHML